MPCSQLISKPLYKPYLFRRSEELYVCNRLLNIVGHFVETWMVVGLAERAIDADEVIDPLFLPSVLAVASGRKSMAECNHDESHKSRNKNLKQWNRDVTHGLNTFRSGVSKGSPLRSDRYAARKERAALTVASTPGAT